MGDSSLNKAQLVFSPIAQLPLGFDLSRLAEHWRKKEIPFRVVEQERQQVIYAPATMAERVVADVKSFTEDKWAPENDSQSVAHNDSGRNNSAKHRLSSWYEHFRILPVTLSLILLSCVGFLVGTFQVQPFFDLMVMQTLVASEAAARLGLYARISIEEFLYQGHYWRLITPVFLHFGWAHIAFNMLWLWELGRRIERAVGSLHLLMVVFFIGIASNLWQAESTPLDDFGGMSGVIYGLLTYCGVFYYLAGDRRFALPPAVYLLMVGSLLLGYSGLLDRIVLMANTAHLMGLVYGFIIAVPSAFIFRWLGRRDGDNE